MEPFMNFKSYADTAQKDNSVGKQSVNYPLVRQTSVYSLTFEEFQHTLGGGGVSKDFGSMNMEDLLKSIWTAEEGQTVAPSMAVGRNAPDGNFQSQGSLTLPRTLSQKTVDEVWKDVLKETVGAKDGNANGVSNLGQREPTLGEVTLEEFLFKAGMVREDTQPSARPSSTGIFSLPQASVNSSGLTIGFQQSTPNHGLLGNQLGNVINSPNLGINMSGGMSTQQLPQQSQLQLQPLFPKQTTVTFSSPSQHGNNAQLTNSATEGPTLVTSNGLNNSIPGGGIAMGGLRNGAAGAAVGSPASHIHPDAIVKSSTDTPSVSPSPYNFGEGGRGRRAAGSLEKVVERRRKRMIKNRESAARSRARKQAYTLELEAEVAKLKEMNEELRKKQEEFMKMQKNQNLETMSKPQGAAQGRCLRRTVTGPW